MRLSFVTGLGAVFLAVSAPLTPLHAMTQAAAETGPVALELATYLNDIGQGERNVDQLLSTMSAQAFSTDPNLAAMKSEYPGIEQAFVDAMRPIMIDEVARIRPAYDAALAAYFSSNFTPAEIAELLAFWRSPAGRATLEMAIEKNDYAAISKEIVAQIDTPGEEFQISDKAVDADIRRTVGAVVADIPAQHRTAIMRFGVSPVGRKLGRLMPQKRALDLQWVNRPPSAEAMARMETEIPAALFAFLDEEDRKRAEAR